jgi:hypothetical protein
MRRRVRCGPALGSRTMWPVIGGDWGPASTMLYRGRSGGAASTGLRAATGGADGRRPQEPGSPSKPAAMGPPNFQEVGGRRQP